MGKRLIPWQRDAVDVALELLEDGSWAYTIVVVSVQRQAGKTTVFGPVAHERAAVDRDAKCWWTAQTRQDARDSWMDMLELVRRSPLAAAAKVRESNGSEAVTYPSGGSFRPFAPTEDALHGKANELVAIDEAWAFDHDEGDALDQAILPTFTTTGGQLWIISTAGTAQSTWLKDYIDKGRAAVASGRREGVCLIEYGVDVETADQVERAMTAFKDASAVASEQHPIPAATEQAYDEALTALLEWHPAAPKFGGHLKLGALKQAAEKMTPGGFLRAYGNHWTGASEQVIPAHAYAATKVDPEAWPKPTRGDLALAVATSIDGEATSILAAYRPTAGSQVHVDVLDRRPGTSWVAARVKELRDAWGVTDPVAHDSSGPVLDVADRLGDELGDDNVRALTTREYVTACAGLLSAFKGGEVAHCDRPDLAAAVSSASRRQVGDGGWAFARIKSGEPIDAVEGVAIARHAYLNRPPAPEKPAVVVRRATDARRRQAAAVARRRERARRA